jgi:hypothetical protein
MNKEEMKDAISKISKKKDDDGHDWILLALLADRVIGPMLDKEPHLSLQELADRLNDLGCRNSRGGLIKRDSIPSALQLAFGVENKYRRRDFGTQKRRKKAELGEVINHNTQVEVGPNDRLIESDIKFNYPKSNSSPNYSSVRDSDKPNTIKPLNVLTGQDADSRLEEIRDEALGESSQEEPIIVKPSDEEYYHSRNQFITGPNVKKLRVGAVLKVLHPSKHESFNVKVTEDMMKSIKTDLRRWGTSVFITIK